MPMLRSLISLLTGTPSRPPKKLTRLTERQLIEMEAEIGKTIFGPETPGQRREFFCLDRHTWIWHEEGIGPDGRTQSVTTRYEIHPNGVLKAQNGLNYRFIEDEELENFDLCVRLYYERVMREIYRTDPYTGQRLETTSASVI